MPAPLKAAESKKDTAAKEPFDNSLTHLLAGLAFVDLRVRWAVQRARAHGLNPDDEFRGLYISDQHIDKLLNGSIGQSIWPSPNGDVGLTEQWPAAIAAARADWEAQTAVSLAAGQTLGLERVRQIFDLTATEVEVLLLALAPELDPRYEQLFAYLQDDVTKKRPTVDLILNLLTHSFTEKLALRRLFTAESHLVKSQLLHLYYENSGREPTLLGHFVRPAGALVEYLVGHAIIDPLLATAAQLLPSENYVRPARLNANLAAELAEAAVMEPIFAFRGGYGVGQHDAGLHVAHAVGRPLLVVDVAALSKLEEGLATGLDLVGRDGRLHDAVLYLQGWDSLLVDGRPVDTLFRQMLDYPGILIVAGQAGWQPYGRQGVADDLRQRAVFSVYFDVPDFGGRLQVWQHYLGDANLDLREVANNFRFSPGQIEDAIATARDMARWDGVDLDERHLFAASRAHSNQKLATLATKIKPRYSWADIVLPEDTFQQLQEMVYTVRQKPTVYGDWGFDRKLAMGKGLHALFAGEPGTGKTMAAEIMAAELGLDLYKIDLSTLVSKYIGETEKNLDKIFTEAATSNAILFFDEADAIFGKRSEVKDSHDRYANIEISYLLQRMEMYDGVVILATNLRSNMDEAFTRRLHFAIEFPFPEPVDRERIWRVTVPPETPLGNDVDFKLLSERFRIAGGNIRNIVLASAFLAAEAAGDDDGEIRLAHLLHAARREYQKMGRLIDEHMFTVREPAGDWDE